MQNGIPQRKRRMKMLNIYDAHELKLTYTIPNEELESKDNNKEVIIDNVEMTKYVCYTYFNFTVKSVAFVFVDIDRSAESDYQPLGRIRVQIPDPLHYEDFLPQSGGIIFCDVFEAYLHILQMMQVFDTAYLFYESEYRGLEYQRNLKKLNIPFSKLNTKKAMSVSVENGYIYKHTMPLLFKYQHPHEIHRNVGTWNKTKETIFTDNYYELPEIHICREMFDGTSNSEFYCAVYKHEEEKKFVVGWYPKTYCYNKHGGVEIFNAIRMDGEIWYLTSGSPFPKKISTIKSLSHFVGRYRYLFDCVSVMNFNNVLIGPKGDVIGRINICDIMGMHRAEMLRKDLVKMEEEEDD